MKRVVVLVLATLLCISVSVFAETGDAVGIVEEVFAWVEGDVGITEEIVSIAYEGRALVIVVDLGEVEEVYDGQMLDLAADRTSAITDDILEHDEIDSTWDAVVVSFENVGLFVLTKEDIEDSEYGRYFNIYNEDYSYRIHEEDYDFTGLING